MAAYAFLRLVRGLRAGRAARMVGIDRDTGNKYLREAEQKGYIDNSTATPTFHFPLSPREKLRVDLFGHLAGEVRDVIIMASWPEKTWFPEKTGRIPEPVDTPTYKDFLKRSLGAFAASYVRDRVPMRDGDRVAVGGGRTMLGFAENFNAGELSLFLTPLATGGRWRLIQDFDASVVLQTILSKHAARPASEARELHVICPEVPLRGIEEVRNSAAVQALFGEHAQQPSLVICSIGRVAFQPKPFSASTYVRMLAERRIFDFVPHAEAVALFMQLIGSTASTLLHDAAVEGRADQATNPQHPLNQSANLPFYYMDKDERLWLGEIATPQQAVAAANYAMMRKRINSVDCQEPYKYLARAGIVAELCRYGIDPNGNVVEGFLEKTSLAVEPRTLKQWKDSGRTTTILVVGGRELATATRAVVRGGYFSVVIVDTGLADELVKMCAAEQRKNETTRRTRR